MKRPCAALSFLVALRAATAVGAQQPQPAAHNPIVTSITGTNAEPDLFRDVNLSSFDLLTGSLQWKDADQSTKVIFAPLKLRETSRYIPILSEFAINLAQSKGITTFGTGVAYNSKPLASDALLDDLRSILSREKGFRDQMVGESAVVYDRLLSAHLKEQFVRIHDEFYTRLARRAFIASVAFNAQTFGILGGDRIDVDEDGIVDNHYRLRGHEVSSSLTYTASQKTGITVSGHLARRRQSSREDAQLASYPGWSVAIGHRVRDLNPRYRETENYLKSLFIPAIVAGVSLESERCTGSAASCDEATRSRRSLTPFVEVKVTPETQFRIGVPLRRTVAFGGTSKTELAAAAQYVIQLKGVK